MNPNHESVYGYALATFMFAECMLWPDRNYSDEIMDAEVEKICIVYEAADDLECAMHHAYRLIIASACTGLSICPVRHPHTFTSLLSGKMNLWQKLKQKSLKKAHRRIDRLNAIATIYLNNHLLFLDEQSAEVIDGCRKDLEAIGQGKWFAHYAEAIEWHHILYDYHW